MTTPRWNPLRLLQTLAYFQVVPFFGSLDWLFPAPPIALATPPTAPMNSPTLTLFDFSQLNPSLEQVWGAVDDVVMGGVSESQMQWRDQRAIFAGVVSTGNGGGFASVRTRNLNPPLNLEGYQGLTLQVRGDGQRYKFLLRCQGGWDSLAYAAGFDTVADLPPAQWQTVTIPWEQMRPVFRAKTVSNAPPLASNQITSMQIMLSKFEYDGELNQNFRPGAFQLEVRSIAAYR